MTLNEYQEIAKRTINYNLAANEIEQHALFGMVGELGEILSVYQKLYQGHFPDEIHLKKELGDLMWFIAEYCTANEWTLDEICQGNIEKLMKRYPNGFEEVRSLKREEDDI